MADDNLFDRLNALKPTSISIKQPSSTFSVAERPPVSKEDDLASRLKSLRIAKEKEEAEEAGKSQEQTPVETAKLGDLPAGSASGPFEIPEESDDDLFADDDAVNDLLMEIAAEQGFGDEDADEPEYDTDELIPLPDVPSSNWLEESKGGGGKDETDSDDEEHSKQVEELLQKLAGTPLKGGQIAGKKVEDGGDSDESDGDIMESEIRRVLERAKNEAALEGSAESTRESTQGDGNGPKQPENDALGLPSVPTSFADIADDIELSLPSAPTQELPERGADDDISQRLAGLRGLRGKAAGLGETDSFGLPSVPTFKPGDEGGVLKRGHYGFGRVNYTDEDQQTWCIVCLEDATIRCVGCAEDGGNSGTGSANNAYCEGCWRNMHVGPAAGFGERGHMRVPLKKVPWP